MTERKYILPQNQSITAQDCHKLLEAIQRGDLDEFDLKNEINAQWNLGYQLGARRAKQDGTNPFTF